MPPSIKTAETAGPLSPAEAEQLNKLLAKTISLNETPATRFGEPYVALTNLMVPRRSDPKEADLVHAGETLNLLDHEVAAYGPRQGRQVAVVRPLHGPASGGDSRPIPPRAMSGRLMGPPADARPDPAGSSAIQYVEPAQVPEAGEPQPGTENWDGDAGPGSGPVDAEDIIPSRTRVRQAQAQAQRG